MNIEPGDDMPETSSPDAAGVIEDDAFLDSLAFGSSSGDPLGELLRQYRADLSAESRPALRGVSTGAAAAAALAGEPPEAPPSAGPARQRAARRWKRRGAAGCIGVVVALSGVGAAAAAAHPGQLLYPLRRAIAGPRQDAASREITELLNQSRTASGAEPATLMHAQTLLSQVSDPELRADLQQQLEAATRVPSNPAPLATPPPVPAPTSPAVVVTPTAGSTSAVVPTTTVRATANSTRSATPLATASIQGVPPGSATKGATASPSATLHPTHSPQPAPSTAVASSSSVTPTAASSSPSPSETPPTTQSPKKSKASPKPGDGDAQGGKGDGKGGKGDSQGGNAQG